MFHCAQQDKIVVIASLFCVAIWCLPSANTDCFVAEAYRNDRRVALAYSLTGKIGGNVPYPAATAEQRTGRLGIIKQAEVILRLFDNKLGFRPFRILRR